MIRYFNSVAFYFALTLSFTSFISEILTEIYSGGTMTQSGLREEGRCFAARVQMEYERQTMIAARATIQGW